MNRARRLAALAALSVAAGALVVLPPATPAFAEEIYPRPASGVYYVDGHGWGHGRGLNQWGAQGAALTGVTATQILNAYYPGTTQTTIPESPIRVLIQEDEGTDTQIRSASGLAFADVATGKVYPLSTAYPRWRAVVDSSGFHLQALSGSSWVTHRTSDGKTTFAGPVRFQGGTPLRVHFASGYARDYRGTVLAVRNGTTAVATVNSLSLEHYLYGVVPRESPSYFHTEALRAQSIAARSYSAYKRAHVPAASPWDICSTTQCQVYGGMRHISAAGAVTEQERASTNAAVDATRNTVRAYGGQPIFAEFSSSNGGWSTAHSTFPYLAAKQDDWDKLESPHHAWTATVTAAQIEARYPSVGRLSRLRVVERDGRGEWGGRVKRVILEGVRNGVATSVEATGGGIYFANPWAGGSSDGLRSSWWKIRVSGLASSVVSQTGTLTLVRPPGRSGNDHLVELRNSGSAAWPVDGLHLAVAEPAGAIDQLAGGSSKPGVFLTNVERPGATSIEPGERARFRVRYDLSAQPAGTYRTSYRIRLATGEMFGATVRWTIYLIEPAFRAKLLGVTSPDAPPPPGGVPAAVSATTVLVDRTGDQLVRVRYQNVGNVTWPVRAEVRLGTSSPRGRVSPSAGDDWIAGGRVAALAESETVPGATGVSPGQVGVFLLPVHGNGRAAGATYELFEPLWEGRAWMGSPVGLHVILLDRGVPRHAEQFSPVSPASVSLKNHPDGTALLRVRLRNLGGEAWSVGTAERLGTVAVGRDSKFRTSSWASPELGGSLVRNVSRPAVTAVHPGEVGEWELPLSATKVPAGTYVESFQATGSDGTRYGPAVSITLTVSQARFTGTLTAVTPRWTMARTGRKSIAFDVRNTGDVAWPVGGLVRSAALSGSGSAYGWLSPTRPASLTINVSRPGSASVLPGEVARFVFVVAGNGRAPGTYTETYGVAWDAYDWNPVRATVSFTLT